MARTFGCLPSDVWARGTTFDIMVYDVLMAWDQYREDKKNGRITPPKVDEKDLMEILKKSKG